jgi:hypothetical protein
LEGHNSTNYWILLIIIPGQKKENWPDVVAYTYNLSYSRSRDWEDHGSRPAQAKS